VNVFLDSSVLLAACGSAAGASPGDFLQRERTAGRLTGRV